MTTESGVRRIVVGVDGSAESVAALRWACREASFCAAEVLAVLALESSCHQIASYAVPVPRHPRGSWGAVREVLRRAVGEAVRDFPGGGPARERRGKNILCGSRMRQAREAKNAHAYSSQSSHVNSD